MIAKLIAHGADRDVAIDRLRQALDGFYIAGVRHNIAFLAAIAASERFRAGRLSTDFIAENFPAASRRGRVHRGGPDDPHCRGACGEPAARKRGRAR